MDGSISAPFIRYPIATSLLMVGVLFVGVVAYPKLPVAPLPQVDFPTIQVSALLPGASPVTMASSVAQPLETQFALIPGVALDEFARIDRDHDPVRPRSQHRRRGQRHTVRN
jgi:hydrophobic/amphiphilic exporter-1 (mainly G- bacteria), HAE1 family